MKGLPVMLIALSTDTGVHQADESRTCIHSGRFITGFFFFLWWIQLSIVVHMVLRWSPPSRAHVSCPKTQSVFPDYDKDWYCYCSPDSYNTEMVHVGKPKQSWLLQARLPTFPPPTSELYVLTMEFKIIRFSRFEMASHYQLITWSMGVQRGV